MLLQLYYKNFTELDSVIDKVRDIVKKNVTSNVRIVTIFFMKVADTTTK